MRPKFTPVPKSVSRSPLGGLGPHQPRRHVCLQPLTFLCKGLPPHTPSRRSQNWTQQDPTRVFSPGVLVFGESLYIQWPLALGWGSATILSMWLPFPSQPPLHPPENCSSALGSSTVAGNRICFL